MELKGATSHLENFPMFTGASSRNQTAQKDQYVRYESSIKVMLTFLTFEGCSKGDAGTDLR
jgi:hypothetical protein